MFESGPSDEARATWGSYQRSPLLLSDGQVLVDATKRGAHGEVTIVGTSNATGADLALVAAAASDAIASMARDGATVVTFAADHPAGEDDPFPNEIADRLGLTDRRDLRQLRRPLPVGPDDALRRGAPGVLVRPIDLGGATVAWQVGRTDDRGLDLPDVEAWIRVNNRAFAHHPDQGQETRITFALRLDEELDDPSAILVADDVDRPGEFSGFCWTKIHPATDDDPELGEIYVIGVDPCHAGAGLGASFTLAGLDRLASKGVATAMLYVDEDNAPARKLYDRLGFSTHHRRRVYSVAP